MRHALPQDIPDGEKNGAVAAASLAFAADHSVPLVTASAKVWAPPRGRFSCGLELGWRTDPWRCV